jgi:putative intracellular protease/amidase/N-acetylglutamate synthase-like GNAT family acetyltransferase
MSFRTARPDEAESLTNLVMQAKAHWSYGAEQLEAWRPSLTVTPEQLRSQPAFVLETDRVVGFYSLRVGKGTCELDNLWVAPSQVGRGYGRQLLSHAMNIARGMGMREIVIDADPNAASFYAHCGATVTGAVPAPIGGQPGRIRPQLRLSTLYRTAVVWLYPGCTYFEVAAAVEVLSQHFEVLHLTPDGSEITDSSGRTLTAQGSYADLARGGIECVLIPGGDPGSIILEHKATAALRRIADRGALMAGICAGNLVLASAGLLKGVRATHNYTPEYAPAEKVAATAPYWDGILFERADLVEDGKRITAQHWAHEEFAAAVARHLGVQS